MKIVFIAALFCTGLAQAQMLPTSPDPSLPALKLHMPNVASKQLFKQDAMHPVTGKARNSSEYSVRGNSSKAITPDVDKSKLEKTETVVTQPASTVGSRELEGHKSFVEIVRDQKLESSDAIESTEPVRTKVAATRKTPSYGSMFIKHAQD